MLYGSGRTRWEKGGEEEVVSRRDDDDIVVFSVYCKALEQKRWGEVEEFLPKFLRRDTAPHPVPKPCQWLWLSLQLTKKYLE